jgi:hypothetical protein
MQLKNKNLKEQLHTSSGLLEYEKTGTLRKYRKSKKTVIGFCEADSPI